MLTTLELALIEFNSSQMRSPFDPDTSPFEFLLRTHLFWPHKYIKNWRKTWISCVLGPYRVQILSKEKSVWPWYIPIWVPSAVCYVLINKYIENWSKTWISCVLKSPNEIGASAYNSRMSLIEWVQLLSKEESVYFTLIHHPQLSSFCRLICCDLINI